MCDSYKNVKNGISEIKLKSLYYELEQIIKLLTSNRINDDSTIREARYLENKIRQIKEDINVVTSQIRNLV